MGVTISTHNGSSVAIEHNIRNRKVTDAEAHIDRNGVHETWQHEPIRRAYNRLFGEAVRAYNENQERPERRISNYYRDICHDEKKHPVYEMIIGIYGDDVPVETGRSIMREFVDSWQRRNPNLELIGAYYHADEEGQPHVHIDYIPVAHGYRRGPETQTGLVKALGEMGFKKTGRDTAQILWERRENQELASICAKHSLQVVRPESRRQHVDTALYKAEQSLKAAKTELQEIDQTIGSQKSERSRLADEVAALKGERKTQEELQAQIAGTNIFGRPKSRVSVDYEEYRTLQRLARLQRDVDTEWARIRSERQSLDQDKRKLQQSRQHVDKLQKALDKYLVDARQSADEATRLLVERQQEIERTARQLVDDIITDNDMAAFMRSVTLPDGRSVYEHYRDMVQDTIINVVRPRHRDRGR